MIPVLYNKDETRFINNGIGRLSDCISCIVTEERNGIYECEFTYPITGIHFDEIEIGKIVTATHDDTGDIQPFVIYSRTVPDLNGIVTFNAHHISYRLSDIVVMPFTAGSAVEALSKIKTYAVGYNPFEFWTDKTTTNDYELKVPNNARSILGGEENSILDVFGKGDYEFDKFTVKLYTDRGTDSDVEIRYGKNLTELSHSLNNSDSYNAVVPYWADDETIVTLPEGYIAINADPLETSLTDENLAVLRTDQGEPIECTYYIIDMAPMDLSDVFEEPPTVEQLRQAAIARFRNSGAWLPNENLTVDFVQLWQTEEFADYAALQRVRLCDTVSVYYGAVGIEKVKQKVVKTVYNVLLNRYDSIELGTPQTSLGQAIRDSIITDLPSDLVDTSMMDEAIQYATDLIRGGLGGYVVMTPGDNGYPQEILIMDTPDINTAVNVWRFNRGGLGHSHSGYNGPFNDIALTQDGRINANLITTGVLNANLITAGTITDATGKNYWNLDSGQFVTKQGTIGGYTIGADSLTYSANNLYMSLTQTQLLTARRSSYSGGYGVRSTQLSDGDLIFRGKWNGTSALDIGDIIGRFQSSFVVGSSSTPHPELFFYIGDSTGASAPSIEFDAENSDAQIQFSVSPVYFVGDVEVGGDKNRRVKTDSYGDRLLYSYEMPSPMFGDIGEAVLDDDGICYVDLDDIFSETIADNIEYQVFLQKEGQGDCWITEKDPRYFVIQGTPNLKVAWELKAKQFDYSTKRLEEKGLSLQMYDYTSGEDTLIDDFIAEQEELLYGND